MNNNQMNFDPITGQPINQNVNDTVQPQPVPPVQPEQSIQPVQQEVVVNNPINIQQMQNIPTVEQSKQEFINNTQANNAVKKEEKKDGPNITFIVILFVIIFAAIFFLFPYLMDVIG